MKIFQVNYYNWNRLMVVVWMISFFAITISYNLFCQDEAVKQKINSTQEESGPDALHDSIIEKKSELCRNLVLDAASFVEKNGIPVACRSFQVDKKWMNQEMFLWIFDDKGYCITNGNDDGFIWKHLNPKDEDLKSLMARLEKIGAEGGFVNLSLNGGYCRAYVKMMILGKRKYYIGSHFYPASVVYLIDELVGSAIGYLQKNGVTELAERINNPLGIFVRGDITLSLYDMQGICLANGEQVAFVGTNMYDATTGDGKFLVRDVIRLAKEYEQGWYSYQGYNNNAPARAFYKKVKDESSRKEYVLIATHYIGIDDDRVITTVKNAVSYLKANGKERAFKDFTSQGENFSYGSVHIFVYDVDGKMLADTANPAFVGLNLINSRDTQGRPITLQIIETVEKNGTGWAVNNLRNAYQVSYAELVKAPDGDFIVGAAYFPISKRNTARFMVSDAELFIKNNSIEAALQRFTQRDLDFMRGDLFLTVYNEAGICLADGLNKSAIWNSFEDQVDERGQSMFKKIQAYAKSGGGWISFPRQGGVFNMFIRGIEQIGFNGKPETIIVTTGYFD